jgi:hypothetical protein
MGHALNAKGTFPVAARGDDKERSFASEPAIAQEISFRVYPNVEIIDD